MSQRRRSFWASVGVSIGLFALIACPSVRPARPSVQHVYAQKLEIGCEVFADCGGSLSVDDLVLALGQPDAKVPLSRFAREYRAACGSAVPRGFSRELSRLLSDGMWRRPTRGKAHSPQETSSLVRQHDWRDGLTLWLYVEKTHFDTPIPRARRVGCAGALRVRAFHSLVCVVRSRQVLGALYIADDEIPGLPALVERVCRPDRAGGAD